MSVLSGDLSLPNYSHLLSVILLLYFEFVIKILQPDISQFCNKIFSFYMLIDTTKIDCNEYLTKKMSKAIINSNRIINTRDPKVPPIIMAYKVSLLSVITGVGTIKQGINSTLDYSSLPSIIKNITIVLLIEGRSIYEYTLMV